MWRNTTILFKHVYTCILYYTILSFSLTKHYKKWDLHTPSTVIPQNVYGSSSCHNDLTKGPGSVTLNTSCLYNPCKLHYITTSRMYHSFLGVLGCSLLIKRSQARSCPVWNPNVPVTDVLRCMDLGFTYIHSLSSLLGAGEN